MYCLLEKASLKTIHFNGPGQNRNQSRKKERRKNLHPKKLGKKGTSHLYAKIYLGFYFLLTLKNKYI